MAYQRISADSHIDLPMLAPDIFTANATPALKERMPYVTDGPDGPYWTCKNGGSFGLLNGVGPAGQKLVPGQNYRVDVMAATGLYEDGNKGHRHPTDPVLRAKDMDRDGVQAEVIFGILGAATRLNDPVAANEMFRIYNDWLVDFCKHDPTRFLGLACLPYGDIDAAVKEVHRVAKLGLRGVELSCSWDMEPMWHPMWEPLWKTIHEVNLPLHFHTFPAVPPSQLDKATGLSRRAAFFTVVSGFQMNLVNILAAVIGAAVLERYPERAHLVRRERHRLDSVRARPHGLRVGGPLPRPRPHHEAERLLAAPVQGHVPVRPHRRQAHRRDGRRDLDVGLRLSPRRRRVARVRQVHPGAVRPPLRRLHAQDHLRERGALLRPDQVGVDQGESVMKKGRVATGAVLVALTALVVLATSRANSQDTGATVKPVRVEKLANAPGQTLTVVTVSYAPGAKSTGHRHAGSVFAYVLSGAIRSENSATGPVKVYKAGESFFEPAQSRHLVSENASATEPATMLVIFVAEDGAQLTTFDK